MSPAVSSLITIHFVLFIVSSHTTVQEHVVLTENFSSKLLHDGGPYHIEIYWYIYWFLYDRNLRHEKVKF